ncbi:MAG: hypothetical protein ACFFBP_09090 [Promethearchaeota archaeon]
MNNDQRESEKGYISKIIKLINNNIIGETSARAISLLMGLNRNYLSDKQLKEGKYEQYTKFFTLATNFLLLSPNSLNFKSNSHYKKFIDGSIEIIFQEMVRKGIYSKNEILDIQMTQFIALIYTLYAITKAMINKYSKIRLDELKTGKTKKFLYTLNKLSLEIGGVETLSQTLKYEMVITPEKIALIKSILDNNKSYAFEECTYAIDLIGEIPRLRYSNRAVYIGSISHPVLENYFREMWLNKNIFSKHEVEFNKPISNHRIDSILDIKTNLDLKKLLEISLNINLGDYNKIFIDYTLPSLISLKQSGGVLDKLSPDKYYLENNRLLFIVFYGYYNNKIFDTLNDLLNYLNIPHKSNVRFIDLIDFAKLFGFNTEDIQMLEYINQIIQNAFLGDEESLKHLEKLSNSALYKLRKLDKRKK